jgi:hypothetical protein
MANSVSTTEQADQCGLLAQDICRDVLKRLGFRDPKKHPDWAAAVVLAQKRIDGELEAMKRIAMQDAKWELDPPKVRFRPWWPG